MPGPDGAANASKPHVKRSRKGCHACKKLKIKCDEIKPRCSYCIKNNIDCDYSLKLTWGGRPYKDVNKRKHVFNITDNPPDAVMKKKLRPNVQFNADKKPKPSRLRAETSPYDSPNSIDPKRKDTASVPDNSTVSSASPLVDMMNSSPAFSTPNGVSLLSYDSDARMPMSMSQGLSLSTEIAATALLDSEAFLGSARSGGMAPSPMQHSASLPPTEFTAPQKQGRKPATASGSHPGDFSKKEHPLESPLTLLANITEFSQGVESFSDALERMTDGKQSNDIFNNLLSGLDKGNSPGPENLHLLEGRAAELIEVEDNDFLSDYSTDLAKIEAYSPTLRPNLLSEFQASVSMLSKRNDSYKVLELDDEDSDRASVPMDLENSPQSALTPPDPKYYFETIPPALLPLPEILNQVPHYRQLMHFWLEVASTNLVPAPSHIYKENPFKVLLPQMAMEYPAVLTTLLAFAATWMATISGKDQPVEILNQLVARSCTALVKMLKDKELATSDGALATVLLFSCYEGIVSHDFDRHRAHTIGARQIIMARKAKQRIRGTPEESKSPDSISASSSIHSNVGTESDVAFFLMRWFVYIDVIGALSATKRATDYLAHQEEASTYEPAESVNTMNAFDSTTRSGDPKRDIDHILGFDVKILPYLTDIVCLIRRTNAYLEQPGADTSHIPISIITKALEVKEQMTRAYEAGEARRQQRLDEIVANHSGEVSVSKQQKYKTLIKQDKVLSCTNKLFSDMGLLNLYRRVLKIPRESSLVQDLANGMGHIAEAVIESKSSAEICSIFCNFCAACETLNDHYRKFYFDRFSKLTEMGSVSAMKSLQIMQRCWATGEDWISAATKLEIDLTLL